MKQEKIGRFIAAVVALFFAFSLFGCNRSDNVTPEVANDEIALQIMLDTKEDIGLLIVDYDANGSRGSGGTSHATSPR